MELIIESGKRIYMEENLDVVVARLYDENGIFIDQKEFSAEFLYHILFDDLNGGCKK